ncbi:class I SAM-dependent methyltransferase [Gracilibacillus kekensis]|uniref:Methyltransferase domain-containing protein n=1 Tax=Gracilibacillus kekensis TaxID=1027249 RepID=A0A1M7NNI2_9BACI|nr:class I SAM-dependent methyltransferase [Gracilibacillus kekensis]SHN05530.1 Methyltransferase domain-containing protein [Gracilibacillus kekensis]
MEREKRIRKYDKQVKLYENTSKNQKFAGLRKRIIKNAYGKILEVGVGAGANFPYYNKNNVEITAVDFSPEMIKSAKRAASKYQLKVEFIQSDVNDLMIEKDSYDCIVSTLTLCSYAEPIETLNKFSSWCHKGGSILLMEHGLSSNRFLTLTQKVIDPFHNKLVGCHCNRDINKLLDEANLQIDHRERYWSDIVYLIWAKPNK